MPALPNPTVRKQRRQCSRFASRRGQVRLQERKAALADLYSGSRVQPARGAGAGLSAMCHKRSPAPATISTVHY